MEYLIAMANKTFPQPGAPPGKLEYFLSLFIDLCFDLTMSISVQSKRSPLHARNSMKNTSHQCASSQLYTLMFGAKKIPVYCHMGNFGCGDGGWTLAMKIDGARRTFHYDSQLWSDRNSHNLEGGKTGFDHQETKLPTYWNTPFSKICLGMKIGHQISFIVIHKHANSLFSLIADGKYRFTSLRRDTWKTLIGSEASLRILFTREGFNAKSYGNYSKARIGILGGGQSCRYCISRIGFGAGGAPDDSNTCGNVVDTSGDRGANNIKAMGYILFQ